MAEAPGHLLGQFIGSFLEAASEPELRALTERHGLVLDVKGERPGIRAGKLLSLLDANGNKHDLDFVIERSGVEGAPTVYAAFVECAWRRYTKHSKAKVKEIQGAVLPLIDTYKDVSPTPAAIVAGQWSRPSIKHLESWGFVVMLMDFRKLADAFKTYSIDIEGRDDIPDAFWAVQVERIRELSPENRRDLIDQIRQVHREDYDSFIAELEDRIIRTIQEVVVYPLHGTASTYESLDEALSAVRSYSDEVKQQPFLRFEFVVRYTNGDVINGSYASKEAAVAFLKKLV